MGNRVSRVVCAVVIALLASPLEAADAADAGARLKLRDGFVVAPGSRLLGPVFPRIAFTNPAFDGWSGWTAVLDVTGDAGATFDEYVGQARALGLDVAFSDQSCHEPSTGDVRCGASATNLSADNMQFEMMLRVCTSCAIPVSAMTIQLITETGKPTLGGALGRTPPAPSFATHLDAEMRLRQRRALPKPGQEIPYVPESPQSFHFPAPLRVAMDTHALAAWKQEDCGNGGAEVVLRSNRPVTDVFAKYREQVRRQANESHPNGTRRSSGDTEIAVINGDYTTVNVVGARNGTWILAEQCFPDD
jgi:hypothetical protein